MKKYQNFLSEKFLFWVVIFSIYSNRRVFVMQPNCASWYEQLLAEAVLSTIVNLHFEKKYEKYQNFSSDNFPFLVVQFFIYLNRRVFVMQPDCASWYYQLRGKHLLTRYASNEETDKPAYLRSLIGVFVILMKKLCILDYLKMRPVKILHRLHERVG